MSATLNKLIVLLSLFCILVGYQNFGRVQAHEITKIDLKSELANQPDLKSFKLVAGDIKEAKGCLIKPVVLKSVEGGKTWLKADWGESASNTVCAKPRFVGWSVYDSEGEFVLSLENEDLMAYSFPSHQKYNVILSYSSVQGSGEILRAGPEVLDQLDFEIVTE